MEGHRNLVVGGHNIVKGRYPYFVSIDKNNGVVVNGALIAPDIVLSAGHIALNHMDNLTLKVGPYAVHDETEVAIGFAEEIPVEAWVVPPNWEETFPGYFANDYLILKLARKSSHRPVKVNRDPSIPSAGQHLILAGLGWTNEFFPSPASIVQEVELMYVPNPVCENTTDPMRGITYNGKIDPTMLCTIEPPGTGKRDGWYASFLLCLSMFYCSLD